jgi:hypothetical protein
MRSAVILGKVAVPEVENLARLKKFAQQLKGCVDEYSICPDTQDALESLCGDAFHSSIYATMWIGPHRDDVIGDITLGIVISGDHYLFTGNGRRVGDLVPGTVYALLNKKMHGAFPRDRKNPTPLIFAACEPNVPAEDWGSFCRTIEKAIQHR